MGNRESQSPLGGKMAPLHDDTYLKDCPTIC